jgi:hypothetical protein
MESLKRVILISLLTICLFAPMSSQAQATPIGVELDCDQSTININVHPEQNEPVIVSCTVTNTGSFKENIDLDSEVDGNEFSLSLSESSFELDAGDDANFIATFSASPRIEVTTEDYNISATVISFGVEPIFVPLGQLGSTAEINGEVNSLAYSRVDLEVSNPATRNIEVGEEATIQFTMFNDGNRVDNLEVIVVNIDEIEDAGFEFATDPFVRATVNPGASSNQGAIILIAPDSASDEITIQVQLRAVSTLDTSATPSEASIRVVVASSGSDSAIDFNSMDSDSYAMIGMVAGGVIGVILLLVVISRLTKKAGKQKTAVKQAHKAKKANKKSNDEPIIEEEDDLDFDDDFGDLDDDFDFDDL